MINIYKRINDDEYSRERIIIFISLIFGLLTCNDSSDVRALSLSSQVYLGYLPVMIVVMLEHYHCHLRYIWITYLCGDVTSEYCMQYIALSDNSWYFMCLTRVDTIRVYMFVYFIIEEAIEATV
ncbi:putative integral membrane protein [Brugia pahangi]